MLAEVEGRFAESLAYAREALSVISGRGHETAEVVTSGAILFIFALVSDEEPDELKVIREVANSEWPVVSENVRCYLALWLARRGQLDEAARHYRRVSPYEGRFGVLQITPLLAELAVLLGDTAAAAVHYDRLLPYGEYFVSGGAGTTHSYGSLHLVLGRVAAFLGRGDEAIAHFQSAIERNRQAGARPFAALAECDLANALWRCRRREQVPTILRLLDTSRQAATDMGMAPLLADLERLAVELRAAQASPLTRREHEVAQLVARGLTNRQMATALHLSERTAENHVEHILNKLGFSARSQIAAWVGSHEGRGRDQA
jgi:DNA-binding CsgD family transcriptional regulator